MTRVLGGSEFESAGTGLEVMRTCETEDPHE